MGRVMPRLERFMEPFVDRLIRREQIEHAGMFVRGLLSDLEHKNAESIAYRFGQERKRCKKAGIPKEFAIALDISCVWKC